MPPKPDRPPNPESRTTLARLVHRDPPLPCPRLEIRLSAPTPTRKQLAATGLDDASVSLIRAVAKRQPELGRRLAADRNLAERFVSDPAAVLSEIGVPQATIDAVSITPASQLSDHVRNVLIRIADDRSPDTPPPAAALDLLAATFVAASGDPVKQALLRTNPKDQVVDAAAAHPPAGIAPGSAALASLIIDVSDAILRAATGGPATGSGSGAEYPSTDGWVVAPGASTVIDIPIAGR